ncbi:MAG: HEAT repeat domain-containing protein, partial [Planctomycetia bacterium]|nr:HEAT repeat domain-containing protein [Planctomycetia bacterium]
MHRMIIILAGAFSASGLLLVDSAVKGTALLALAAVAAMLLRRDSAATRHLVWLLAIVALLALPLLSAALPQWRVLPDWAGILRQTPAAIPSTVNGSVTDAMDLASNTEPVEVEPSSTNTIQPAAVLPDSRPAPLTPQARPEPAAWSASWINLLPLVWGVGFLALILRLMAARWMLWSTERQGTVICSARQRAREQSPSESCDSIRTAFDAACSQLRITRPVTLLIHPGDAIPVVWGILRSRLLLPAAARHWSGEQLRSVLLHELAHVRRRDTMTQLLTQIVCALQWFNPLVWFAAWRLGVERERACDDLVLASGVRPSAYARHLLDVATALTPAPWTQACGLAMARPSSLEGRLVAVLSKNLSRRGVPASLAAVALAIGAGLAVPLAMLGAADEKKPDSTAATSEVKTAPVPADDAKPKTTVDDLLEKFSNAATFWEQGEVARKLIDTGDTTIIGRIEKRLDTPDRRKRCNAALVLAGLADKRGLAIIIGELEDTRPRPTNLKRSDGKPDPEGQIRDDRYYAALLLGELKNKEALPALIEATKDESVSGRAATSLGEIGDHSAIPALRKMATDFPAQRLWADYGLAALGEQEGFDHLSELARTEEAWTERRHAVEALAKIGDPKAVPVLVKALKDKHANVRVSAAIALGKIGDPAALPALTAALSDTEATEVNAPTTVKSEAQKAIDAIKKNPRAEKPDGAAPATAAPMPKHESAQGLFKIWQQGARTDGKIPGGALRSLAGAVESFIKLNPTNEKVPQLTELQKRIDISHDWSQADVVNLLDDLTAIHPTLPDWGHPPGRRG